MKKYRGNIRRVLVFSYHYDVVNWNSLPKLVANLNSYWSYQGKIGHSVEFISYEVKEINKSLIQTIIAAEVIVVYRLTLQLVNFFTFCRNVLGLQCQFLIYIEESPSIGLKNLARLRVDKFLNSNDYFIVSNHSDVHLVKNLCNLNCLSIPAHTMDKNSSLISLSITKIKNLAYIGRLSEQKNIHTLIAAFALFKSKNKEMGKLYLYGCEDFLGSPNMGLSSGSYLNCLKDIIVHLGLEDEVVFKGFVEEEDAFAEIIANQCLFVSMSLHSDEDFGFAPFEALTRGVPCLLTSWIGFSDFKLYFEDMVTLVNVFNSSKGPFVCISELANSLELVLYQNMKDLHEISPVYFKDNFMKLIEYEKPDATKIIFTDFALKIHENIKDFNWDKKCSQNGWVFKSYRDPLALEINAINGAVDWGQDIHKKKLVLSPWTVIDGGEVIVSDPHRGVFTYVVQNGSSIVYNYDDLAYYICERLVLELLRDGVIFPC